MRDRDAIVRAVQDALTPDLLKPRWRKLVEAGAHPHTGHCYVATEAIYHLLGGRNSGWAPTFISHEGSPHWFLRRGTDVLDATSSQFATPVPYHQGIGKGFLTAQPSKRARIVMERALGGTVGGKQRHGGGVSAAAFRRAMRARRFAR